MTDLNFSQMEDEGNVQVLVPVWNRLNPKIIQQARHNIRIPVWDQTHTRMLVSLIPKVSQCIQRSQND